VICELCRSATVLDPESATELIELYSKITLGAAQDKNKVFTQQ